MSSTDETVVIEPTTEPEVSAETAKLVASTPGAGHSASKAEAGRTAEEKQAGLTEATEATAEASASTKSIYELAAGDSSEMSLAIQQIAYVLERNFNIDFVREASLAEVQSGEAAAKAAMSPGKESPQLVDDGVVPVGVTIVGDDVLPPNIPAGSSVEEQAEEQAALEAGSNGNAGPVDEPPAQSATRAEWDAYAEAHGVPNASELGSKQEVIDAVGV